LPKAYDCIEPIEHMRIQGDKYAQGACAIRLTRPFANCSNLIVWGRSAGPRLMAARFPDCKPNKPAGRWRFLGAMKIAPFFFLRLAIVILAVVGIVGWFGRESLLQEAANLWIVSDPLTRADAIVVLGGSFQTRPAAAADLYWRGLANKVLVSHWSDWQLNRAALLNLRVPASAIEAFGKGATNTREEAVALREWAERNAASTFVIPSEPFFARRVQWIFRREFSGRPVTIEVQSLDAPSYFHEGWWKTEQNRIAFQNEILKYLYYRWKY